MHQPKVTGYCLEQHINPKLGKHTDRSVHDALDQVLAMLRQNRQSVYDALDHRATGVGPGNAETEWAISV